MSRAMTSNASWRTAALKSMPATYCGAVIGQAPSVQRVEHGLHDTVEVGELALAVVEDVPGVGGGPAGGRPLLVDLHVLLHHRLEPLPVGGDAGQVLVVAVGVPQLPRLEPGAVDRDRDRAEQL